MIQSLFTVKCALENHVVSDVIKIIQQNCYLLDIKTDTMNILNDYFTYDEQDGKFYILQYKKVYHSHYYSKGDDYVNMGHQWFRSDNIKQYITLTYKKIKVKNIYRDGQNVYRYGLMIKMSRPTSYEDLPSFKRIESRIMENTKFTKIKSRYNRIYLV